MIARFKLWLAKKHLRPTERELLEADAAWWKDCSEYWQASLKQADADVILWRDEYENAMERVARLSDERDRLSKQLWWIKNYTQNQKSGTARKVTRMVRDVIG